MLRLNLWVLPHFHKPAGTCVNMPPGCPTDFTPSFIHHSLCMFKSQWLESVFTVYSGLCLPSLLLFASFWCARLALSQRQSITSSLHAKYTYNHTFLLLRLRLILSSPWKHFIIKKVFFLLEKSIVYKRSEAILCGISTSLLYHVMAIYFRYTIMYQHICTPYRC